MTNQDFTRVNNCVNGNPRYVCHYLEFKKESDNNFTYEDALFRAKELGGRRFHNKQYGGGVIFQSYNIQDTTDRINLLTGESITYYRDPTAYELKRGYGARHHRVFPKLLVTNRAGNLKKWFKCKDDGLNYSLK